MKPENEADDEGREERAGEQRLWGSKSSVERTRNRSERVYAGTFLPGSH